MKKTLQFLSPVVTIIIGLLVWNEVAPLYGKARSFVVSKVKRG